MWIFPDIRSFVDGRETGISGNWRDRASWEDIRSKQLTNLFNAATFSPRVQAVDNLAERGLLQNMFSAANDPLSLSVNQDRALISGYDTRLREAAQPGMEAVAGARAGAQAQYAPDIFDNEARATLQQQGINRDVMGMNQAQIDELVQLLLGQPGVYERWQQSLLQRAMPLQPTLPAPTTTTPGASSLGGFRK